MKEITDIISAYQRALSEGKKMALATVVHVEGSSYRRPGARMLVTEDGQLTGAISGGCLEGDALRKALLAISQQSNKLVTYDTMDDDDDAKFGVQLGCNGIVHILFEPIDPLRENHPIELLIKAGRKRANTVLITLFSMTSRANQPGSVILNVGNKETISVEPFNKYIDQLDCAISDVFENEESVFKNYTFDEQKLTAFIEFLQPPVSLIVVGAGNDAIPLVAMASLLGWEITVADGRANQATAERFPLAGKVIVAKSSDVISQIACDAQTVFVLMTHNYNYDLGVLKSFLSEPAPVYIGSLGPKKKLEKMFQELIDEGITVNDEQKSRVYGPVGLDIGAETSEEIALSVLAEIKAVLNKKPGTSLRDKKDVIHSRQENRLARLSADAILKDSSENETETVCGIGPM